MFVVADLHWLNIFATNFRKLHWQKWLQWLHLNNSHAYPFCKTTPGTTSYLDVAIATCFVSVTRENFVAKLFCQCNLGCTLMLLDYILNPKPKKVLKST